MNQTIVSQVRLTLSSLATRRNIQDLQTPTDISNTRLTNQTFPLPANNVALDNAESEAVLGAVRKFLHLTFSLPVEVTFTRLINDAAVVFTVPVTRHLTMTADFTEVKVKNINNKPVTVRAITA